MSENNNAKKAWIDRLNDFLMKDNTFILLIAGAAAAIFAGTFMFINYHTGAFNEVSITAMLSDGMSTGDYSAAAGFAAGFLIARILEGPLVGLIIPEFPEPSFRTSKAIVPECQGRSDSDLVF